MESESQGLALCLQSQLEAEDIARSGMLECFDMARYAVCLNAECYSNFVVHV